MFDICIHCKMITTIKLINIFLHIAILFVCVMRAPEICSFSLFPVFSTILLIIVKLLCNRYLDLLILHNCNFYPLTTDIRHC